VRDANNVQDLKDKWVSCRWNFEANDGRPHPDEALLIPKAWRSGCVARCLGVEGEYLLLSTGSRTVRVVPFSAKALPRAPKFSLGQRVRVRAETGHSAFEAPIQKLDWHFKNSTYVYFLVGKSTRYSEEELEGGH
jgi:hypothetical protein